MDDPGFDALARRLMGVGARRALLRGLPAAIGIAMVGPAAVPGAGASKKRRHKRRKRRCGAGKTRCGNQCVRGNCCPGQACGSDGSCGCVVTAGGNAACVEPIAKCANCNAVSGCGQNEQCIPGGECLNGACAAVCVA